MLRNKSSKWRRNINVFIVFIVFSVICIVFGIVCVVFIVLCIVFIIISIVFIVVVVVVVIFSCICIFQTRRIGKRRIERRKELKDSQFVEVEELRKVGWVVESEVVRPQDNAEGLWFLRLFGMVGVRFLLRCVVVWCGCYDSIFIFNYILNTMSYFLIMIMIINSYYHLLLLLLLFIIQNIQMSISKWYD